MKKKYLKLPFCNRFLFLSLKNPIFIGRLATDSNQPRKYIKSRELIWLTHYDNIFSVSIAIALCVLPYKRLKVCNKKPRIYCRSRHNIYTHRKRNVKNTQNKLRYIVKKSIFSRSLSFECRFSALQPLHTIKKLFLHWKKNPVFHLFAHSYLFY